MPGVEGVGISEMEFLPRSDKKTKEDLRVDSVYMT